MISDFLLEMVRSINQTLQIIECRRKSRAQKVLSIICTYIKSTMHHGCQEENHISDYRNCGIASVENQCLIQQYIDTANFEIDE